MPRTLTFVPFVCLLLLGLCATPAEARYLAGTAHGPLHALSITSATPSHGLPGTDVTLAGGGFGASKGSSFVEIGRYSTGGDWFGWGELTTSKWTDAEIVCRVNEIQAGAYKIRVTVWMGQFPITSSTPFTVDAFPAPSITGLTPDHGLPGSSVVISGSGFRSPQGASYVEFGSTRATVTDWGLTGITCQVPDVAPGPVAVAVIVLGQVSNTWGFAVDAPAAPKVDSLTPDHGLPGASVIIAGSGFGATQDKNHVKFGTTEASVTNWTATGITCQIPDMAPGLWPVAVTVGAQTSNTMSFTVDPAAPLITGVTPNHGVPGASVTIAGSDFGATQGTSSVKIGTTVAAITSWSATSIVCQVPTMASGGTNVVVTVGSQTSNPFAFTVDAPVGAPQITSMTPDHGLPGSSAIVNGSGFGLTQGTSSVRFGVTLATVVSWSATSIACQVPTMAVGATTVAVTVGTLTSNAVLFTIDAPVSAPKVALKLGGLRAGALKLGRRVTARCTVTPIGLAGESCSLIVQKKIKGFGWLEVMSKVGTIDPGGRYSWKYKPAARGSYRMQASITATAQHTAARSLWRSFEVK
jgi:hypothetical protein